MAENQKRRLPDNEEMADEDSCAEYSRPDPKRRNIQFPTTSAAQVMTELHCPEFLSEFESLCREVVREEIDKVFTCFNPSSSSTGPNDQEEAPSPEPEIRRLELHFINKTPLTIFTGSKIQAEDGQPLQVALRVCDDDSKAPDRSLPLSSSRIELVVLDGKFGSSGSHRQEGSCWTVSEFNESIVSQREGKRPLIVGKDLTLALQDGVGFISDLSFTDNSSWIKCRKFRLGARIKDQTTSIQFPRIKEAISEPFLVKDQRLEGNKKHHPPNIEDEVWRLEGIGKDGAYHRRLCSQNITTVYGFLQAYRASPSALRTILGDRVPEKAWKAMVNHAKECWTGSSPFSAINGWWAEDYQSKCAAFDNGKLEAGRRSSNASFPRPGFLNPQVIHQDPPRSLPQEASSSYNFYGVRYPSCQDFAASEEILQPSATSCSHDEGGTS